MKYYIRRAHKADAVDVVPFFLEHYAQSNYFNKIGVNKKSAREGITAMLGSSAYGVFILEERSSKTLQGILAG